MKPLITLFFLLITTACFAQRQNVYFYKNNGLLVHNRDSADYIRVVSAPDSGSTLYNVFESYPNGKTRLTAKSSTADPLKFEGLNIRYYPNGQKQSVTTFKNGRMVGENNLYYPNGRLYLTKKYPNLIDDDYDGSYLIIAEYDTTGKAFLSNGNGYYKGYDEQFAHILEQGNVKDGFKDGAWKGIDTFLHVQFTESYDNGKLISGVSVGLGGDTVRYTIRQIPPLFKGGPKAFGDFLGRNIKYPKDDRALNIQGKAIVQFVVDKDGTIVEAKIVKSVSNNIDEEALRVINLSPKWIPGMEYGRPVRVQYIIPLNFSLTDRR